MWVSPCRNFMDNKNSTYKKLRRHKRYIIRLCKVIFNIHDADLLGSKNNLHPMISDLKFGASKMGIITTLVILYAFGILLFYSCISQLLSPVGGNTITKAVIRVSPGMNIEKVGLLLSEKGFIRSPFVFQLTGILSGTSRSLKAGDYAINTGMSLTDILKRLVSGETILYKFTIPEGFTVKEIARMWEESGFGTSAKFLETTLDPSLRSKYGINSDSLEGYLFPNTYMFPSGISEKEAIETMLNQFVKEVSPVIAKKPSEFNFSLQEIITLASIVEKEARIGEERPIISAVFHNRLKLDMKLESCPTVLYGLDYPDRKLTYDDLRNASLKCNTYVYKGLPPVPICNPGIKSITAAINPTNDNFLYFVAKNDGTHYFTQNYNDFLSAKRKYQGT
jgi:UPF0755 protein